MIELTGTLLERLEQAVRLVCTEVSQEEVDGIIALYRKAGVKLLPSNSSSNTAARTETATLC